MSAGDPRNRRSGGFAHGLIVLLLLAIFGPAAWFAVIVAVSALLSVFGL